MGLTGEEDKKEPKKAGPGVGVKKEPQRGGSEGRWEGCCRELGGDRVAWGEADSAPCLCFKPARRPQRARASRLDPAQGPVPSQATSHC